MLMACQLMRSGIAVVVVIVGVVLFASPAGAQWVVNGSLASNTTESMTEPRMASDGFGGAVVVWAQNADGIDPIGKIAVQRWGTDGTTLWGSTGVLVSAPLIESGIHYRITGDGEGGAIVGWFDGIGTIWTQRLSFLGTKLWGSTGVPVTPTVIAQSAAPAASPLNSEYGPVALLQVSGGVLIAFTYFDTDFDIYIQKVSAAGAIQWGAGAVAVCAATGSQGSPTIVSDGEGGAIVAWVDFRSGDADIYAQRINFLGTPVWTTNGVAVCTATGVQDQMQMVSVGTSGAIIGWEDKRNGFSDMYAQRLDASGTPQWTTNGMPISVLPASASENLAMVSDDNGGAIMIWVDTRLGAPNGTDIFGQRVTGSGTELWATNGLRLTDVPYNIGGLFRMGAARDGTSGVIGSYLVFAPDGVRAFRADSTGINLWDERVADSTTAADYSVIVEAEAGAAIVEWEDRRVPLHSRSYAMKTPMIASSAGNAGPAHIPIALWVNPNPFSEATEIRFSLDAPSDVTIDIYDVRGRSIASHRYASMGLGTRSVFFDSRNDSGALLPNGVYFLRVDAARQYVTRKLVIIR